MEIKRIMPQDAAAAQVWQLREEVLRRPLGLSLKDEDLSGEVQEITLAALEGEEVIGCVLLKPLADGWIKLRQMAVAEKMQGRNIGRALVRAAERIALEKGYIRIELHARDVAAGFYRKLGYRQEGEMFTEVNIPHLKMVKELTE